MFIRQKQAKQLAVAEAVRHQILARQFRAGDRLPTCRELAETFGVSRTTVQQALDQLSRDGFVESRSTAGTFVATRLPHVANYGLVFPSEGPYELPSQYVAALLHEVDRYNAESADQTRISIWRGIDGRDDNEDYRRLVAEVRAHRMAGLIFATPPRILENSALFDEPGVPRVAIAQASAHLWAASTARVEPDQGDLLNRAAEYFARRGRSRVAIVLAAGLPQNLVDQFARKVTKEMMLIQPYWIQRVHTSTPQTARALTHLLLNADQHQRPDALLIADDNLVEHATAGIIDAQVRVGYDIDVVAHCNFPWPTPSVVPVRRLGFDLKKALAAGMSLIDRMRGGESVHHLENVLIPAEFGPEAD